MAVNLSPVAGAAAQFFDNSGNVLTGGKLYTYDAGTTTPAPTYTSSNGVTAHPNPIILNAAGRVPDSGEIWLADSVSYKFVLKDANDVLIGTYDNLVGINSNFVNFTGEEEQQIATQGQTVFTLTTLNYQPATNNLLVFVNGSKQISGTNYQETSSTVITFVDGLNVGDVVDFCTATPINTSVVTAAQVSYNEGDAGAVTRTVENKLQESISVKDFGAIGDGVTDDTTAIQTALDLTGAKTIYFPPGTYKIDSLEITEQFTTISSDSATLLLNPTGTFTHALKVSTSFFTIVGSLTFDGDLNSNYDSTLWIKGGYGRYENINFRLCKLAILIGEDGVNQPSLSEMFFSKCITNGCRNGVEMYGLYTVGTFTDCILVGGEDAVWNGQDVTTVKIFGGRFYAENSYFYGAQTDAYPIFELNQAEDAGIYYTGYVSFSQCESEVYGKPFIWVNNLSTTGQSADSGGVTITNCRLDFYLYSGLSPQPDFFRFNNYFTGRFVTKNNQIRFTQPLNKRPFVLGTNTQAQINFEDMYREGQYYGTNAATFTGLPPQSPFQTVLSVTMNSAFTAGSGGTAQPVKFDTIRTGINGNRFTLADSYSTSTGVFTVPSGGLSSIMIVADYRVSGALGAAATCFIQHYSSSGGFTRQYGYQPISTIGGQVTAVIPEAGEGDEFTFKMYTDNSGAALDVGLNYNNQMTISAYITTPNSQDR